MQYGIVTIHGWGYEKTFGDDFVVAFVPAALSTRRFVSVTS